MVTIIKSSLVVLALTFSSLVLAANVSVEVDRDTIAQDETFNVVFTYAQQLKGEPDFSLLETDFQVISQNRRSNLQIINGNYQYELSWVLTLLPKRAGILTIASIPFGVDQSPQRTVTVTPAAKRSGDDLGDIFLETELTPVEGYVQAQFLFTVRIFFRGWLIDGDLSEPDIGTQDVVIQSLGEPTRYAKVRNGERYQVYERRHALFPQSSGTLDLAPTVFSGRLRLPNGSKRLKRVTAEGITTQIKPSASAFTGDVWLPATGVEIVEDWPSDTLIFEQGVPITRTLTIKAKGLSSAQLPELKVPSTDEFRVYPDQPSKADRLVEGGIRGERTQSVALVPQAAGDITLPEVKLAWWDTVNDRQQVATLPARTINVAASVLPTAVNVVPEAQVFSAMSSQWYKNLWFWIALGCAFGWIVTWFRASRGAISSPRAQKSQDQSGNASTLEKIRTSLRVACQTNNASQARMLAERYVRKLFSVPSDQSLQAKAALFTAEFNDQWQHLNQVLYGPENVEAWESGPALWTAVQNLKVDLPVAKQNPASELQPL